MARARRGGGQSPRRVCLAFPCEQFTPGPTASRSFPLSLVTRTAPNPSTSPSTIGGKQSSGSSARTSELDEEHEIEIERVVAEGSAAQVQIHAVAETDLLVVSPRGHGGSTNLLIGSVSQQSA
jgi:nucleotide-binding universal stress UspA family protein